jgi:hypothetical protein
MSWAGVHSENLASVWLLYHLCDHLSAQQFQEVAYQVGLSAKKLNGETDSYETYAARIRDRHGIIVNRVVLESAAYDQAVINLETDFIFENRLQEYTALKSLRYGSVIAGAASQLDVQLQDKKLTEQERQEIYVRKSLLAGQNYLDLVALHQELLSYRRKVENPWSFVEMSSDQEGQGKAFLYYDQTRDKYIFSRGGGGGGLQAVDTGWLRERLLKQDSAEQEKFWSEVSLASQFSSETISMVRRQVDIEFKRLSALPPYSLEVLSAVQDFRILVGLRYLINLARELGIKSQLDPVLSFPLGSNVVTLLEFVRMYEGLVTGEVVLSENGGEDSSDLLSIIDRIESSEGEILYQPKRKRNRVVAPETSLVVGHILENIVKFGTGRDADKNVRLKGIDEDSSKKFAGFDLAIPLLGKTGTANNYTNASFFGYLPGLTSQGELVSKGGYAVGVYVGFDDNEDMRRSSTRITGSEGALPTWIELVRVLLKEKGYGQQLDPVEISFSGLALQRDALGQLNLAVEANRGGVLPSYVSEVDAQKRTIPSIMDVGERDDSGRFVPLRQFKPYWRVKDPSVGVNF